MPLSELYHMAKGKPQDKNNAIPADLSRPENDVFELVWENGHILLQGQSSNRTIKNSNSNTPTPRLRDRDIGGDLTNSKMGRFAGFDSVVRDVITLAPSSEVELVHDDDDDDDMVPWLNYPNDYSSEFLPELSGVTVNDLPSHTTVASSLEQVRARDAHLNSLPAAHLEDRSVSKVSSLNGVDCGRPGSSRNQLYSSASHQCHPSFPHLRTRDENNTMSKSTHVPSIAGCSSSSTRQKLDPKPSSNSPNVINFSHFLRPAASLSKSNLQNHDGVVGAVSLSRIGSNLGSMDKDFSATSSQPHEPSLIGMRGSIRKESNSCGKNALFPSINDTNPPEAKPPDQSEAVKQPEVACLGNSSKKDDHPNQLEVGEKAIEPVTAASLCSRNSFEGASDDPIPNMKRKCHDIEDSEGHSDDVEEESVGAKRATRARGTGFKRSRAAEVHNLSERRRRDRINEKMRALQELIPNCNKVDKASMLDEAIEYLKTLQLQVQIMSMGAGLFMSPMMFAGGMQPMTAPHMAHYSPMGVGMGMGFGIGMPDMNGGCHGYPFVQAPHMQGTHFPGQSIPGQTAMHGMPGSNFQVLGVPGQGLHMSMPRPPIAPFSGGPFMTNSCVAVAPMETVGLAAASSAKDVCQNINTPMAPNDGIHTSITPSPRQAHEQAFNVNGRAVASTSKENLIPN